MANSSGGFQVSRRGASSRPSTFICRSYNPVRLHRSITNVSFRISCNANQGSDNSLSVAAAEDTVNECICHAKARNLEALLSYVPDQVIELAIQRKGSRGGANRKQDYCSVTFEDIVRAGSEIGFMADAWAFRHLVYAPPQDIQVLSGLKIESGRYLMRCLSFSSSGEEGILTFGLREEEYLVPHYKGLHLSTRWALDRVSGEQGGLYMGMMPTFPRPNWSPDTVVQSQLDALRRDDMEVTYGFMSSAYRLSTGPLERFETSMRHPAYAVLMDNVQKPEILAIAQAERSTASIIVGLPNGPAAGTAPRAMFLWLLSLQGPDTPYQDCWMVDSIQRLCV